MSYTYAGSLDDIVESCIRFERDNGPVFACAVSPATLKALAWRFQTQQRFTDIRLGGVLGLNFDGTIFVPDASVADGEFNWFAWPSGIHPVPEPHCSSCGASIAKQR